MESGGGRLSIMIKRIIAATLTVLGTAIGTHAQAQESGAPDKAAAADMLRAGDVVKLWIWREEDMSGEFQVPESGIVALPKLGAWKVTGRPTGELKAELVAEYKKYLRNAAIEITFLRRVNVLGAVNEPGVYSVDPTMTVANALALAGGTRPDGKPDQVQLYRDGAKLIAKITQRTRIADLPIQSGDQLFVPERSWLARNTGLVAALVPTLISVTVAILAQN
jgi:polysaccharide export outer membrane protein